MLTETDPNHLIFHPRGLMGHSPPNQCHLTISITNPFGLHRKWKWTIQRASLAFTFLLRSTPISGTGFQCLCIYWDCWRDCQRKMRVYFFSSLSFFFFSCAISCLQKPLMPIQHQHQGTALMSILATDLFLSPLPAAHSVFLPLLLSILLYPFAHSLWLLYSQIIKRIVGKMILPGN